MRLVRFAPSVLSCVAAFVVAFGAALAAVGTLAACGDDPVSYSDSIAINLKAKSADTTGGAVSNDKGINTENGNPYGAFISAARAALGGNDPTRIEVTSALLLLGANSTGVSTLEEIFGDNVEVLFIMNDTNNTYPVAHLLTPTGPGPLALDLDWDADAVSGVDLPKLVGGSFKVVIRGDAAANFETKGADADLQVTLKFEAFE